MPYKLFKGRLRVYDQGKQKTKKPGQGIIFLTNKTMHVLNVAVKAPVLCHFYNRINPGETVYFRTGDVTVTLKVKQARDDGSADYTKTRAVCSNIGFALGICLSAAAVAGVVVMAIAQPAAAAKVAAPALVGAAGAAATSAAVARQTSADGPPEANRAKGTVETGKASVKCSGIKPGRSPCFVVSEDSEGHLQLQ